MKLQKEIKAAGEAVKQEAYEKAYDHVFQILDNLEKLLNDNRYLEGNEITEEDKRLYDILIRFDAVYYFKQRLNRKALRDYDNLWNYAKELYSIPEYKEFADFEKIKQEELLGTKEENPYQIVGLGPDESYWNEPGTTEQRNLLRIYSIDKKENGICLQICSNKTEEKIEESRKKETVTWQNLIMK